MMMRKQVSSFLVAVSVASLAQAGDGGVTYLTQDRWVEACGFDPVGCPYALKVSDQIAAPDFEPFVEDLVVGGCAAGRATQASTLDPHALELYLLGQGSWAGNGNVCSSHAAADVTFQVDVPMVFRIKGILESSWCPLGEAWFALKGEGVDLYFEWDGSPVQLDEFRVLQPGVYAVSASASGGGNWGPFCHIGQFQADLTIDFWCLADCDDNSELAIDDFICFQTLFALGDPLADCDASGALSVDDFICFQTVFALGC